MTIQELRALLERLQKVFSAAGSRQSARDVKRLVDILEGSESKSVEQFVVETRKLLDPSANDIRTTASEQPRTYVRMLLEAGDNRPKFDVVLGKLRSDKTIGRKELAEIANAYFNDPTQGSYAFTFKSKAAAYAFMIEKFVERAQMRDKFQKIGKIAGGKRG